MRRGSSVGPSSLRRSRATCPSSVRSSGDQSRPRTSRASSSRGEHARWVFDEEDQQPKLGVGQIDQIAISRPQFPFDEVKDVVVEGANARG